MKKIILSTVAVAMSATLLSATTNKEIKHEAKNAIMKMGKTLKMHMKQNMKGGGPIQAATFCSQQARGIAQKVNNSYKKGVSVKRISLKYRNPANKPAKDERDVLKELHTTFDAKKALPKMVVKKVSTNHYKVYKPILINNGVCLKCHGVGAVRNEKAYKLIKSQYPNDKAIGYKKGDLRGAFVVDIIK